MLEAATLLQLQRSLRNASAVVSSSLSYREHESLLIPRSVWTARRSAHLQLLDSARSVDRALDELVPKVAHAMIPLARATRKGHVVITQQRGIELPAPDARAKLQDNPLEEDLHQALALQFGAVELPRLMMEIDAQVRFSATLPHCVPDGPEEIMAVYGALLAIY